MQKANQYKGSQGLKSFSIRSQSPDPNPVNNPLGWSLHKTVKDPTLRTLQPSETLKEKTLSAETWSEIMQLQWES